MQAGKSVKQAGPTGDCIGVQTKAVSEPEVVFSFPASTLQAPGKGP